MSSKHTDILIALQHNSELYDFKGYGIHDSQCGLTIIERDGNVLLIFTDTNNGTSVTNAIEQLATEIYLSRFSTLSPDAIYVVEHYGEVSESGLRRKMAEKHNRPYIPREDEFDLVKLRWNGQAFVSPKWTPLKPEDFGRLLPFNLSKAAS